MRRLPDDSAQHTPGTLFDLDHIFRPDLSPKTVLSIDVTGNGKGRSFVLHRVLSKICSGGRFQLVENGLSRGNVRCAFRRGALVVFSAARIARREHRQCKEDQNRYANREYEAAKTAGLFLFRHSHLSSGVRARCRARQRSAVAKKAAAGRWAKKAK